MKASWADAERQSEVRGAARGWRRAGVIDDAALTAIEARYPAPWASWSPVWSILAFFFVSVAVVGVFAFLASGFQGLATVSFLFAVSLPFVTERLRASSSAAAASSGSAAAFWAAICLMVGVGATVPRTNEQTIITVALLAGTLAFGGGAWRWGYPAFAVLSAASLFLFLSRSPQGGLFWLAGGLALAAASWPFLDRPSLAPSHRHCAAAALLSGLAAVYAAVNVYWLDHHRIESLLRWREETVTQAPAAIRTASIVATAALPVILIALGLRSRRRLLLDAGIVAAALSLVTLRAYVHLAPLWALLSLAGAGLVGLALAVHRWLRRSPGRQRGGFTGEAVFEDEGRHRGVAVAATALTLAPEPRTPAPAEPGAFRGGGGASGGAGSTESF
jgi:hypothetical protein